MNIDISRKLVSIIAPSNNLFKPTATTLVFLTL